MRVDCKHCGAYLFEAEGTVILSGIICPNSKCKAKMNIKVLFADSDTTDIKALVNKPEREPKALAIIKTGA